MQSFLRLALSIKSPAHAEAKGHLQLEVIASGYLLNQLDAIRISLILSVLLSSAVAIGAVPMMDGTSRP